MKCGVCGKPATTDDGIVGYLLCDDIACLDAAWDLATFKKPDDVMGITELKKGMRVRMPSGQVLTLTEVSKPDADGVVRLTYSADPETEGAPPPCQTGSDGASRPERGQP